MQKGFAALLLGGIMLAGPAWAQETSPPPATPAGSQEEPAAAATTDAHTVRAEDVKTWTFDVDGREYEVHPGTPTYQGDTGLFHLSSAYTIPRGRFSISVFRDNLDRDPKDLDISIHGLNLSYGASDRLQIFGNIGLQNRIDADALFQPGFQNDFPFVRSPWETGVGDVNLGLKYGILDDYRGDSVGLAVRGFVKLPTADEEDGLGTGKVSGGVDLVLSKHLNYGADIHAQIGFTANGDPEDPEALEVGNAFRWGVGVAVPACRIFQVQAELLGTSYSGDDDFEQTNPLDLVVGPVFWIKPGIFIRPALSWNLNFDDRGLDSGSSSSMGRHLAIGYHPGTPCREVFTPPPPPPPPTNRPPTVTCQPEKSTLLAGESVRCRATASDPDGDTLSYEWSASAGRVTGTGAEATFDSTGVAPGTSVTVTVRVNDGRGGTASADCRLNLQQPERRAEAVTCTSGGFPRNLARLNNVDKACLDDVASRLRQDPRSRVIVVGHADSRERYPEVIGRQRAEAVKNYLVRERGIEESRITTRSAAATKPLDTGTSATARAKNRRVELIFVPEGATPPEDDD